MWTLAVILIGGFVCIKFFGKKRETEITLKDSANCDSAKTADKQSVFPETQCSLTGIYADDAVVQTAERCKEGDVSAMRQMAAFLRSRCTPPLTELLDRYEADPIKENEITIQTYLKENFHEEKIAKGCMMWLVQAALYGNAEVSAQLERWPFYKQFAYIPYDMMTGRGYPFIKLWASSFLHEIGFIDVPSGYEDCSLSYNAKERYFDLRFVSDYEPPDEDGFGAEWEYSDIYFNEFFRRLPAKLQSS